MHTQNVMMPVQNTRFALQKNNEILALCQNELNGQLNGPICTDFLYGSEVDRIDVQVYLDDYESRLLGLAQDFEIDGLNTGMSMSMQNGNFVQIFSQSKRVLSKAAGIASRNEPLNQMSDPVSLFFNDGIVNVHQVLSKSYSASVYISANFPNIEVLPFL